MRYVVALLVLTLLCNPAFAQSTKPTPSYDHIVTTGVLRCGYFTWPPFLSKDVATGEMQGITKDIMASIGTTLNIKIEWTAQIGLADFMDDLQHDKFDAVCISNWPQADRFKQALATVPIYYTSIYPVVRADDTRLDISYNPMKKGEMKLGVINGDATQTVVEKLYPNTPREVLDNSQSYAQLLAALTAKQTDVVFLDKSVIVDYMKKNPDQIKIPKLAMPVYNYPEYLFVKRGDVETKLLLDNAIQLLRDSGDLQNLLNKYETSTNVFPLATY